MQLDLFIKEEYLFHLSVFQYRWICRILIWIHHVCCFTQTDPECADLTVHGENEVDNK